MARRHKHKHEHRHKHTTEPPMIDVNIDIDQLRTVCLMPRDQFFSGNKTFYADQPKKRYTYFDRGANILAVAHCDTASYAQYREQQVVKWFEPVTLDDKPYVFSRELDDRLGVYIILHVLPQLGIECDILLTDNEEMGKTTAKYFTLPDNKHYNWAFSFDRRGTDVVMYQSHNSDLHKALAGMGWQVAKGSFSDLSDLTDIGCHVANFGCGYNFEHTAMCSVPINTVKRQVGRFVEFYGDNQHIYYKYDYAPPVITKATGKIKHHNGVWKYVYDYDGYPDDDWIARTVPIHPIGGKLGECDFCATDLYTLTYYVFEDDPAAYKLCRACADEINAWGNNALTEIKMPPPIPLLHPAKEKRR